MENERKTSASTTASGGGRRSKQCRNCHQRSNCWNKLRRVCVQTRYWWKNTKRQLTTHTSATKTKYGSINRHITTEVKINWRRGHQVLKINTERTSLGELVLNMRAQIIYMRAQLQMSVENMRAQNYTPPYNENPIEVAFKTPTQRALESTHKHCAYEVHWQNGGDILSLKRFKSPVLIKGSCQASTLACIPIIRKREGARIPTRCTSYTTVSNDTAAPDDERCSHLCDDRNFVGFSPI